MNTKIEITNNADRSSIDIEGTIGMPEQWQFDDPADRVATYDRFREQVAAIAALGCRHIDVNIRSTGGDVNDALLIYEALRATGAEITTCCYGYTASASVLRHKPAEGLGVAPRPLGVERCNAFVGAVQQVGFDFQIEGIAFGRAQRVMH